MNIFKKSNRKRGFSLVEGLIVVGVIGVLLAVAMPNIISYYRDLKLVELDDSARTIFMAAQNEISAILAADKEGLPSGTSGSCEYPDKNLGVTDGKVEFDYLDSTNTSDEDSLHKILPAGSIESELQGNNYIIEYNHETGAVHAVWYWEKDTTFNYKAEYKNGTDNDTSFRKNVPVGYYGGGEVDRIAVNQMPIPKLTLINAEELKLTIEVPTITGNTLPNEKIMVDVMVNGEPIITGANLWNGEGAGIVVLDTLKTGYDKEVDSTSHSWTVGNKFKDWVSDKGLSVTPGDNITVSVKLYYNGTVTTSSGEKALLPQVASVATNSLFANVTADGTAEIAYGRHLQNLHDSGRGTDYCSGVLENTLITKAVQTKDINFWMRNSADPIQSWASTYPDTDEDGILNFHPISNWNITEYNGEYNGSRYEIRNMYVVTKENYGGLFSAISSPNFSFSNITLVNPHVHADGSTAAAGGLAGIAFTNVIIENCKVYNEYDAAKGDSDGVWKLCDEHSINLDSLDFTTSSGEKYAEQLRGVPHIGAPDDTECAAGGLIGKASEKVVITNSFASVIVIGEEYAGGLVGLTSSSVRIENSYSGSYVYFNHHGAGLVGRVSPNNNELSITNSYAVGEVVSGFDQNNPVGAGFFTFPFEKGTAFTSFEVVNCYSAVRFAGIYGEYYRLLSSFNGNASRYPASKKIENVFYVKQSGYEDKGVDALGYPVASAGTAVTASELTEKIGQAPFTTTPWYVPTGDENPQGATSPYRLLTDLQNQNSLTIPYPYPMLKNGGEVVPHYGDWLEDVVVEGVMLAYVEKYADDSYGFYAAKADSASGTSASDVKNTLKDEIVEDDFYRILSPTQLTGWEFTLDDDDTTKYTLTEDTDTTIEYGGTTYYCYTLENATNWDDEKNYYHEIKFATQKKAFIYNASFACEAFDVSESEYPESGTATVVATDTIRSKPGMDSYVTGILTATDVFIRSARQLANIQAYTNDTTLGSTAQRWAYDQLAKIDFSKYTGSVLTLGQSDTNRLAPAKLTTGSYYGHEKEIKNLYIGAGTTSTDGVGLFGSVGTASYAGGTLDGVRLVNVSVAGGDGATGGLVGILHGIVKNCGIYVESGTGIDVDENYKTKWTVTGASANGVGGLIGQISGGEVSSSFAAVKVDGTGGTGGTGAGPVGGLVGQISDNGKVVEDCYVGGYVEKDAASGKTSYKPESANVTGGGDVGGFVGHAAKSSKFVGVNYSTASVAGPNPNQLGLFAGASEYELPAADKPTLYAIAAAFDSATNSSTAPRDESAYLGGAEIVRDKNETGEKFDKFHYNMEDAVYPYEVAKDQKEHHGDWILVEAMGLYYDTVGGKTGYYANGKDVPVLDKLETGTPGSGAVATDDGYMFVTKDDLGTITIRVGGKSFQMKPEPLTPAMEINGKEYNYKYEVPAGALNTPTEHYYTAVSINGRIFYANFGMACEIFDKVTDPDTPMAKNGIEYKDASGTSQNLGPDYTGIVVRTARQLANIGIATNSGTTASTTMRGMRFEQVLDIDFGEPGDPKYDPDKLPTITDKEGNTYNHVPITLSGATAGYYGNGYTVRNMRPGALVDGGFAENGMFGSVKAGATLKDITLINARVVTNNENNGVMKASAEKTQKEPDVSNIMIFDVGEWVKNGYLSAGRQSPSTSPSHDGFTIKWKNTTTTTSQTNVTNTPKEWVYNGANVYSGTYCFSFGSSSNSNASYIQFTTNGPAIVKIWWVQISSSSGVHGQVKLYKGSINASNEKGASSVGTDNDAYLTVFPITESGTYYLGDTHSNGVRFYRVEVYKEDVPYSESDPRPYDTENNKYPFPEAGSSADGATIPSSANVRAGALAGIVDSSNVINCGVYVEYEEIVPGTGTPKYYTYDDDGTKLTKGTGKTAYDWFIVKNDFSGSSEDYVGGLIGNIANAPNVSNSYAAVKVLGVRTAGGFAGNLGGSSIIENCYVGGHTLNGTYYEGEDKPLKNVTTSDKTNETSTGGFAGKSASTVTFSGVVYTTASVGMAENTNISSTIGSFIGTGTTPTTAGDTTLYATGTMFREDTGIDAGQEVSVTVSGKSQKVKFGQAETYLDETVTMRGDNKGADAASYDDALTMAYPYLVANDKDTSGLKQEIHHGDWPVRVNFVYYELYKESDNPSNSQVTDLPTLKTDPSLRVGVYGVFMSSNPTDPPIVINTLITKGYVYESGYMITAPIKMEYVDFRAVSHYTKTETVNGKEEKTETYSWTSATVKLEDLGLGADTSGPLGENGNYCYMIPADQLNKAPSDEYYMRAYVNGGLYLINPHFACEILNVSEVMMDTTSGTYDLKLDEIRPKVGMKYIDANGHLQEGRLDGVIIRSAWNFASIARYSRESNNGKVKDMIGKQHFYQLLDIDYTKYKENGIYDGNDNNRIKDADGKNEDKTGSRFIYGNVPIILNGGTYEGYNHTVSNVYLSNDSGKNNNYVGLFGSVTNKSTIQNLKAENIHLTTGNPSNSGEVYMGVIAASVDGSSTIKNVEVTNADFDLHRIPVLKEIKDSSNKKTTGYEWNYDSTTAKVSAIGGIVGKLINGTVENSKVNGISIDLNSGKYYYLGNDSASRKDPSKEDEARRSLKEYKDGRDTIPTNAKQAKSVIDDNATISIGGAIGEINTAGAEAVVNKVYVTNPIIDANKGKDNVVGGLIGKADGKADTEAYDASQRGAIQISDSGVYLTDAVVKDVTAGVVSYTDNFNNKYYVKASGSANLGGFVGRTDNYVTVQNCFSAVRVEGTAGNVGGFAGQIEGSVIESCYSGGHTTTYDPSTTPTANVKGGSGATGGFAGKIEGSGSSLELKGTIYTTSSVSGSGKVGLFQGGEDNTDAVEKAANAGKAIVYAVNKVIGTVSAANKVDESAYLLTGASVPGPGKEGPITTENYDPGLDGSKPYPYANSTKVSAKEVSTDGTPTAAHFGDWEEISANAAFYWEYEGGEYRFYAVLDDGTVATPHNKVCSERDGNRIDAWGYGVFSSTEGATINLGDLTEDDSAEGKAAMAAVMGPDGFGAAKTVKMIKGATGKTDVKEVTVDGKTFYINPAYAAAVELKDTASTTLGTDTKPYQIRTVQQLKNIGDSNDKHFEQSHDVVVTADDGYTSASVTNFKGIFDGGFYRILDITAPVFNTLDGARIHNVIVYAPEGNVTITGNGGIANSVTGGTVEISNTIVAGFTIDGGTGDVGGLVGSVNGGTLNITNSEATNTLKGANAGGLVGLVGSSGTLTIKQSYAGGEITSNTSAGGLVGSGAAGNISYTDVYAYVDMTKAGGTVYGIGPGTVTSGSKLQEYWDGGIPSSKKASDTGKNIKGVSLAQIKYDTQAQFAAYKATEYCEPGTEGANAEENRAQGLTNLGDTFPFAAFASDDTNHNHYHYGAVPKAQFVGLFYWEKEVIKYADGTTKEEYHYYAHGGEIVNGTLYGQKVLLDSLCYDHHLTGERASIEDYGYGVFNTNPDMNVTVKKNSEDAQNITSLTATNEAIKNGLIKELWPNGEVTNPQVYDLPSSTTDAVDIWTLGGVDLSKSIEAYPAFGAAIAEEIGKDGMGGEGKDMPLQIRSIQQLQNLGNATMSAGIPEFAITHDIDGSATTNFKPISNGLKKFNGNGYRILDLDITPSTGDAALFSTVTDGCVIEGVILYDTKGDGKITSTDGNAAGIVAAGKKVQIENCVVAGYTITGKGCVGGIVGDGAAVVGGGNGGDNASYIKNCQAVVTLDGSNGASNIGGIAGKFRGKASSSSSGGITDCYAGGKIIGASSATVGGIAGEDKENIDITDSYSYMNLLNTGATATNVYAIAADSSVTITDSYYLKDFLPSGATTQGTAKTVDEMMTEKTGNTAKYVYVPADDSADTNKVKGLKSWGDMYPFAATVEIEVKAGVDKGETTGTVTVHYGAWPEVAGIAQWEVDKNGKYTVWIVGADLMGKTLPETLNEGDLANEVTASGYAVFRTTKDKALTIDDPTLKTSGKEYSDSAGVLAAINKALSDAGVYGVCSSNNSKVYDNKDLEGLIDATATVEVNNPNASTDDNVTLYYNPGTNGIGYEKYNASTAIKIRTAAELDGIPNSGTSGYTFNQTCDIDGKDYLGKEYEGYTGAKDFHGTYDGQGHMILDLSMKGNEDVGLFSEIGSGATLKNIILYSPNGKTISGEGSIGSNSSSDHYGVGGLVGSVISNKPTIENCVVAGYKIEGDQFVGGIVGWGYYGAIIKNCAAVNDIECDATDKYSGAGGILGGYGSGSAGQTEITNCYSGGTIKVSGTNASSAYVGGIAGIDGSSGSTNHANVTNCYTYVDMSKCAEAKVSTISSSEYTGIEKNYYLDDSARIPAWVHKQGKGKTYDDLSALNITGFGKATESYVPENKFAGSTKSDNGMTKQDSTNNFPFPEVPINSKYVHYGDWPEKKTTPASSYPWNDGEIGVVLGYSPNSYTSFNSDSDVVAQMFKYDHTSAGRIGTTTKSSSNIKFIGLVLKDSVTGYDDELKNSLKVMYYPSSSYSIDGTGKLTIKGAATSFYQYDGKEVSDFGNRSDFTGYKLYGDTSGTIETAGLLVIAYDSVVTSSTSKEIPLENIVGWVKVSDLDDNRNSSSGSSGDPGIPDGPEIFDEPVTGPSFDEPATDPEPTEPTEEPTEPTEQPTEPTEQPTEPTEQPTEPTEQPTEPTEQPTEPTEQPTEPTESAPEPAPEEADGGTEPAPEEAALPPEPQKTDPAEDLPDPNGSGPDPETQGGGA